MKFNLKAIVATLAISAVSIFTVGCNPVEGVKGWVDQIFCKHETKEIVEAVAPTCTEDGYTEYEKCVDCGKEVTKGTKIEAHGHMIVVEKGYEATCTAVGKTDKKTCSVCGEVVEESKVIPALGHKKMNVAAVEATCDKNGKTSGVICGNGCGMVYSGLEEIPATGLHTYENGICTVCGDVTPITFSELKAGVDYSGYTVITNPEYGADEAAVRDKILAVYNATDYMYLKLSFDGVHEKLGIMLTIGWNEAGEEYDIRADIINESIDQVFYDGYSSIGIPTLFELGELGTANTYGDEAGNDVIVWDESTIDWNGEAKTVWAYNPDNNDFGDYPQEYVDILLNSILFLPPTAEAAA